MIAEETLEDTVEKVRMHSPEERRIILFTGTHPHEGTSELALPYESLWKRYGVLHVAHPSDSTPHAVWKRHEESCTEGFVPLSRDVVVDEDVYIRRIAGLETKMTVNFHGTSDEETQSIQLFIPPGNNWGYLSKAYSAVYRLNPGTMMIEDVPNGQILVEYMYKGEDVVVTDPFFQEILDRSKKPHDNWYWASRNLKDWVAQVYHQDDFRDDRLYISPSYLKQKKPTNKDVEAFHKTHVNKMTNLLKTISQYLK